MSLLQVENLSHGFGDKLLYKEASFEVYKGEHIGVIGENGTGKSTLIKILTGEILSDKGSIKWQSNIDIGKLDQYALINEDVTIRDYLKSAFCELYKIEEKLNTLYLNLGENSSDSVMQKIDRYQNLLLEKDFYSIDSTIEKITAGLGVRVLGLDNKINTLSGGQRAKVILAKLLLQDPEVLILDEPTNFLDKEHVEWLTNFLKDFKGAYIIVTHNYEFLDNIATHILDIEFYKINKYRGNFTACLNQKNASKDKYIRDYNAQQKEIKKTEEFIRKHIVRATSANQAKDRQKKLEHMDILDKPPRESIKPHIHFTSLEFNPTIVLKTKDLQIGYNAPLFPKMNFVIKNKEKLVVTGFNGIGKSTLLKTLLGIIPAISGEFSFAEGSRIGYYAQDLIWEDTLMTPMSIIKEIYNSMTDKEIRKKLAQAGLKAEHALQPIGTLSGGEQAKVNLCKIMLKSYNTLVLDEPTNHLDKLSKEALKEAIIKFDGTVIIVSHEQSFYQDIATRVVDIRDFCK